MRGAIALLALVGCAYSEPTLGDDMPGSGSDSGSNPARTCPMDPSLRLCVDFDSGVADAMHHVISSLNVVATKRASDPAAHVDATSQLYIAAASAGDLDVPTLTVEMWVAPDQDPADEHKFGIFDNSGSYGIEMRSDGRVTCSAGNQSIDGRTSLATHAWSHVACTYDGQTLQVVVNGAVDGCGNNSTGSIPAGTAGVAIGANLSSGPTFDDQFLGGLDNIWVFDRVVSDSDLCATAGGSGCNTTCPPPEG